MDRQLWLAAIAPGDVLESPGARSHYRLASNRKIAVGYGRWLAWLAYHDKLVVDLPPAMRITAEAVAAFVDWMATVNRAQAILTRLQELHDAAQVMGPGQDWQWIRRLAACVRGRGIQAKDKRSRLVAADDLYQLGRQLILHAADLRTRRAQAVLFRDGLAIALLAARPLRRENFAGLRLGQHVVQRGDLWWIVIDATQTKSATMLEMPWPDDLIAPLQTWLSVHRPHLAAARGRWHRPLEEALWVSTDGSPMTGMAMYDRVSLHTRKAFGQSINPHLFRDCAATSLAINDPGHVHLAAPLLGHRRLTTVERYYNQARALEAARLWQAVVIGMREEIGESIP